MDYSAANIGLWNIVTQFGLLACSIIVATILHRKIAFFKNSLMPTAVLAGFLLLILKNVGILRLDEDMLEMITYHGIAIGFIAMSLRVQKNSDYDKSTALLGAQSGSLIVGTYLVQAIVGLVITIALSLTICPNLFKASGILLPMGYGQGPGQANNIGSTYEALGFVGGRSFGLSLAASGYLCACIVGVIVLNVLVKRGKITKQEHDEISGSVTIDTFQDDNEIPLSESLDKFSMQAVLVCITYFFTFLFTKGLTSLFTMISPGLGSTVNSLLWGFNFIIGSLIANIIKLIMKSMKKTKFMKRQYQNNYLLNRISGFAFDLMIIAGIALIKIEDLSGLWTPFILLSVAGAVFTWIFIVFIAKKIYPDYFYEGVLSMYGMLTGTISSGVILLRELDPEYKTPAANNLVLGSSFAIGFGFPVLILVGTAPKSTRLLYIVLGICVVYLAALVAFIVKSSKKNKKS